MTIATTEPDLAPKSVPAMTRAARILQVVPSLITGGVERGALDVAAALVEAGCGSVVASSGGPMVHELERHGSRHVALPVDKKTPWVIWRNVDRLAELIAREQIDLVHARSRAPAWSAYYAARRMGRPFVTTFHGTYNFDGNLKRRYNAIMTKGERVIAISDFIAEHIVEHYKIDPAKIRVIPRGIDEVQLDPAKIKQERVIALAQQWRLGSDVPVITLPGRLTRWKGHTVLIEALARLPHRDFLCLFVGSEGKRAEYRRELEALILAKGLGGSVRIVGECRDMAAAYMLSDVVVSASTDPEAFGRVAAEASAMGRPVVATDHGGARETVKPGETGWLVKPGDSDALAGAINQALSLGEIDRMALGARGRAYILERFTKSRMCAATLEVYREVLDEFRAR
jgi:glycosyltransferase involved in cell wall biosynthesis